MRRLLGILVAVLLVVTIPFPAPVMAAESSVVATIGSPPILVLVDNPDYIWVDNGQLVVNFYKGTTGYNKIYYPDYSTAVYDSRITLEYWSGSQWKQKGVPLSVSYIETEEGYTVTRHYTDYLGTTYDVDYLFLPDQPIKITVRLHSGQSDTYRIIWSLSGITQSDYTENLNQLDFYTIAFDWADVYPDWGDITTTSVTTVAQGKKADITFDIGYVAEGSSIVLDPSVVGTSTHHYAIEFNWQRHTFLAEGRHWTFYGEGTEFGYRSSTTGLGSWSAFTSIGGGTSGEGLDVFYDGTYFHYVRIDYLDDNDMFYRRGEPQSGGTISWSAAEQLLISGGGGVTIYWASVCVDTSGYPFIAYYDAGGPTLRVTKSDTNDGTWSTQSGFPYELSNNYTVAIIVPFDNGNVYAVYAKVSSTFYGKLWSGSWGSEEEITTLVTWDSTAIGVVSWGNIVGLVWNRDSDQDIYYTERSAGGDWSEELMVGDTSNYARPAITARASAGDVRVFWKHTDAHIYYRDRIDSVWDESATDWIDASPAPYNKERVFSVFFQERESTIGCVYVSGSDSPFDVNYAFIQDVTAPTVTTSPAEGISRTTATLHGDITDTGGENATVRGFEWDTDSGAPYANEWYETGDYGIEAFYHGLIDLDDGETYYFRAYANNTGGTGYGDELNFTTGPPPPGTYAEVEISVSAWVVGYPSSFTLTYVNDNQVDITWTKGEGAENTLVRAASGHVPADRTDGYQVYYGDGESCSDTALTLASPEIIYYRAWSENEGGGWSPLFASGNTEDFMSASFLFIGFILIASVLTAFAYKIRMLLFTMAAAMSWLGIGVWLLLSDSTNLQISDAWTQIFGFVFIVMSIAVLTLQMRTDIRHEAQVRKGALGFPGAATESWTTWGPNPGKSKKQTTLERQADYKAMLKEKTKRK